MGKGKNDKTLSNRVRRKRKERSRKFWKFLIKHPNYYNERNPVPIKVVWSLIFLYLLIMAHVNNKAP